MKKIADRAEHLLPFVYYVVVGFTPFYFRFTTSELFEFNKLLVIYVCAIAALFLWTFSSLIKKRPLIKSTAFDIPILLFVLSQLLATLFSIHPPTSVFGYYSRFHAGLLPIISYITLYYIACWSLSRKTLLRMLVLSLIAAFGVALYAIFEHFGHSLSCLLAPSHQSFDAECWKQEFKVTVRAFATFGQPNWLAAYLVTLIPTSIVLALYSWRKKSVQFLLIGIIFALFASLLFTGSRSGFLGFTGALIMLLTSFAISRSNRLQLVRKNARVLSLIIGGMVGLGLVFGTPFTAKLTTLIDQYSASQTEVVTPQNATELQSRSGGTDSGEIRKIVWSGALNVWKRYPVLGSGLETFGYSYYKDRPLAHNAVSEWNFLYNKAHNEFLNYLATTGAFGFIAYLVLLGWFWVFALKLIIQPKKNTQNARWQSFIPHAFLAGSVGLSITNFFGFSTVLVTVLQFLFMAGLVILTTHERTTEKKLKLQKTPQLYVIARNLGAIISVLIAAFLLNQTRTYYAADTLYAEGKALASGNTLLEGTKLLQEATALRPTEAVFHDELSYALAQLSSAYSQTGEATVAAQFAVAALESSERALTLNPHHLNFYKTRARIYILLSSIDPEFLDSAHDILASAAERSPTDPDIIYNMGVIRYSQQNMPAAIALLEQSVSMKPDFKKARFRLARFYIENEQPQKAREQLQYILDFISPDDAEVIAELTALEDV